jgi:DUF2892 family protein
MGFSLIVFLLLEWHYGVYVVIAIMLFEAITNWRIPKLATQLRHAMEGMTSISTEAESPSLRSDTGEVNDEYDSCKFSYEAERMMRFMVAGIISLGFIFFDESLWFLPWFMGLNLLVAGTTGVCPMVMLFRKLSFQ